jgi:putative ABC transport system permease protein
MTFRDAVSLAFRNLRQAKLRTFLTVLGVSIGIASLAGMVSLGVGLQDQFVDRFIRSGMFDSINVLPGQVQLGGLMGGSSRGGRRNAPAAPETPPRTLDDAALAELAKLEHVREVYPVVRVPMQVKFGEVTEFTNATGVPMSSQGQGAFQTIAHGSFFANDTAATCMMSLEMANRFVKEKPEQLVGKDLTLSYAALDAAMQVERVEQPCRVVGIVERETGPMAMGGSVVSGLMIPLGKARELNTALMNTQRALMRNRGNEGMFQSAVVKVTRPQLTQDVQDRIKKLGFTAFSLNDALQGAKRAFLILDIILGLIGSIALAVASLGIMNTMVMSILERTREIGIMKAIGGSDGDVRRIFLIEASVIGFFGGIFGVVLGWIVGRIINFGANQYIVSQGGPPGSLFSVPLWLVAAAIGFSIFVSLAAGLYPARRASRLDPIHALRHD